MVRRKTAKKNQDDLPPRRRRITPPPVVEKNAQTLSPALRKVILVLLTIFLLTLTIMATVVQVGGDTYRVSPSAKTMLPPLVHGLRTQQPAEKKLKHRQIAHITPIDPTQLPKLTCKGKTVVSIVAHQDDDILFMNPTHIHNLRAGDCLRTIYVTAGDDGNMQSDYWTRREYGSENAYSVMTNTNGATWTSQSVTLADHELVTVSNSLDNPATTFIFMRLPDGNVDGSGFRATNFESLQNLENGNLETIRSVDGQSYYSKDELTTALAQLIQHFEPQRIDTQAPSNLSQVHPDHSDHLTVGKFAQAAAQQYFDSGKTAKMSYYVGYPIQDSPENVSGQDLIDKSTAFFAYARHDNNVCPDVTSCAKGPYEQWLRRQYTHGF